MYFENKRFAELTLQEVMAVHLEQGGGHSITSDFLVESTLRVILQEARHCTQNVRSKQMMPALGCFALLDQVGNCYTRTRCEPYPHGNASGIKKALYYFGGFAADDAATKALYAFRNALMHNASLRNDYHGKHHAFRYDGSIPTAVAPAAREWDGDVATLDDSTLTVVNPGRLVDLADGVVRALNECLDAGTLATDLTKAEIAERYLLLAPR